MFSFCDSLQSYILLNDNCYCFFQVVLSSDSSALSQLSGSNPYGLCHLTPGQNTDIIHFCVFCTKNTFTIRQIFLHTSTYPVILYSHMLDPVKGLIVV